MVGSTDKRRIDVIEDDKLSVRARVEKLAHDHDVHYVKTDLDALAEVVTKLADDEIVKFDETEKLILSLGRTGVIDRTGLKHCYFYTFSICALGTSNIIFSISCAYINL